MPTHELLMGLATATQVLFVFAFGACVGSLINVIVYRLPRGIGIVTPPSRCSACQTRLTWRENIPILGWVILRGRCRFCKARISPEYPLVEGITAALFAGLFVLWYVVPTHASAAGIDWGQVRPEWALNGFGRTWPAFVVLAALVSSLVAVTIIDARTFTIPLVLVWVPAVVAVVLHTGHAVWIEQTIGGLRFTNAAVYRGTGEPPSWTIPIPGPEEWRAVGAAIGGVAGLGVSWLLVRTGLLKPSFADYHEWEQSAMVGARVGTTPGDQPSADGLGAAIAAPQGDGAAPGTDGAGGAASQSALVAGSGAPESGSVASTEPAGPAIWTQYPHARREMVREVLYLAPCLGLGVFGSWVAWRLAGPWTFDPATLQSWPSEPVALWLRVFSGVLLGYLIGGGVVWGVRILGSIAFGKEAMGLGDVHLMAMVGACCGWIDATLAFFLAAFVCLGWTILGAAVGGRLKRAVPYGPFLAVATLLVLIAKPLIERLLGALLGSPVNVP